MLVLGYQFGFVVRMLVHRWEHHNNVPDNHPVQWIGRCEDKPVHIRTPDVHHKVSHSPVYFRSMDNQVHIDRGRSVRGYRQDIPVMPLVMTLVLVQCLQPVQLLEFRWDLQLVRPLD